MASQEPLVARYNLISLLTWCHRNIRNLIWKVMRFATLRYCSRFEMFHFHFTWIYCCCIFFNSAQYTCTTTRTRLPVIFLLFLALVKLAPASPFYVEMDSPSQKVSCFIDVAKPCRSVKWDCNLTPKSWPWFLVQLVTRWHLRDIESKEVWASCGVCHREMVLFLYSIRCVDLSSSIWNGSQGTHSRNSTSRSALLSFDRVRRSKKLFEDLKQVWTLDYKSLKYNAVSIFNLASFK